MKQKSYKISKLEKGRKSILTDNLDVCFLCNQPKQHLHEVFYGRNRQNSMKYNCVVPLCFNCHNKVHNDINTDRKLKQVTEKKFLDVHNCDIDDFISIFKINYL